MTRPPWCFLASLTVAFLVGLAFGFYGAWPLVTLPAGCLGALGIALDLARWGWLRVPPREGDR